MKLDDIPYNQWWVKKPVPNRTYTSWISMSRDVFKKEQASDLEKTNSCDCKCGETLHYSKLFRCFYCGVYLCETCCEEHFGETRQQYFDKKKQ